MSSYPTSTNLPRVDGLSTDPRDLVSHIRLPPMKTKYPEVEHLSVGESAQFAYVIGVTNNLGMTSILVQHTLA